MIVGEAAFLACPCVFFRLNYFAMPVQAVHWPGLCQLEIFKSPKGTGLGTRARLGSKPGGSPNRLLLVNVHFWHKTREPLSKAGSCWIYHGHSGLPDLPLSIA
eukprot:s755_g18.t1